MDSEIHGPLPGPHDRESPNGEPEYSAACPVPGFPLWIRGDSSLRDWDESICREVLAQDTYRLRQLQVEGANVEYAVDVGGHIGISTALIKRLWPDARLIVIEPELENFHMLRRNTMALPDVICVAGAVAGEHFGHVPFRSFAVVFAAGNSGIGQLCGTAEGGTIPVAAWTLEELMIRYDFPRIDLLKLDCEGSEAAILEEARRAGILERIRWIRGEWHGTEQREAVKHALSATHSIETTANGNIGLFFATRLDSIDFPRRSDKMALMSSSKDPTAC
jgi:FkbM family methyltransferase